jgi:hypothetical protein
MTPAPPPATCVHVAPPLVEPQPLRALPATEGVTQRLTRYLAEEQDEGAMQAVQPYSSRAAELAASGGACCGVSNTLAPTLAESGSSRPAVAAPARHASAIPAMAAGPSAIKLDATSRPSTSLVQPYGHHLGLGKVPPSFTMPPTAHGFIAAAPLEDVSPERTVRPAEAGVQRRSKKADARKPLVLACYFCRKRKIACTAPDPNDKDRSCE